MLYHSTWAEVWKQAVSQTVGNCWIHRFLSQDNELAIYYMMLKFGLLACFLWLWLFFDRIIVGGVGTCKRRCLYYVYFFKLQYVRMVKKRKYLSLSVYLWLFPCVTYSCIWRNQGHSIALLALRICQELVPTVIQLIKTINMILARFNVVLPGQHFLDYLVFIDSRSLKVPNLLSNVFH